MILLNTLKHVKSQISKKNIKINSRNRPKHISSAQRFIKSLLRVEDAHDLLQKENKSYYFTKDTDMVS